MRLQALLRPLAMLAGASALLWGSVCAQADDLQDITRLISQGGYAPALEKANAYLAGHPKDAQARFLKGIVLTETGKQAEAIQIFSALTEEFPELPEPYNNLAVIYASQGQYEKARNALELAIHTHPSYGTAHENLGDVYAKLATKSYDKALQLDKNNASAASKLNLIKTLFDAHGATSAAMPAGAPKAETKAEAKADAAPAAAAKPVATASAAASGGVPPSTAKAAKAVESKAPEGKAADKAGSDAAVAGAGDTVHAWASAWSAKDVDTYLSFYSADFKTPNGEARDAWEKQRRDRLGKPGPIAVVLQDLKVSASGKDGAEVSFRQKYSSSNLKSVNLKTLVLQRKGDHWQIVEERVRG